MTWIRFSDGDSESAALFTCHFGQANSQICQVLWSCPLGPEKQGQFQGLKRDPVRRHPDEAGVRAPNFCVASADSHIGVMQVTENIYAVIVHRISSQGLEIIGQIGLLSPATSARRR